MPPKRIHGDGGDLPAHVPEPIPGATPVAKGITPEQYARPNTEHAHQVALMIALTELRKQRPADAECIRWICAIPNGGERDVAVAGRLKAEGVKAGVHDILLPFPRGRYHCAWIEMKKPSVKTKKNRGMSDAQIEFGMFIHKQGMKTYLAHSWDEALAHVTEYLDMGSFNQYEQSITITAKGEPHV